MDDGFVLVIGSAGIDVKGLSQEELTWEAPNVGKVRNTVGGVARNIAENLARLEIPTILLTAVGKDSNGRRIIRTCERSGINCNYVRHIPSGRTGTYMALLRPDGQLQVAISDFEIISHLDPDYILEHEYLLAEAQMIVIDATLSQETLTTIFEIVGRHNKKVVADPTTPALAAHLCPYLNQLYMVVPNASEIVSMCGIEPPGDNRETAILAARELVQMGAEIAVVTLGEAGLAYADSSGGGFIPAVHTNIVDTTGAGDAFTSAAIFGLLNEVPIDEAMRLGVTAAALTIESTHTVLPRLSQELLYDRLMA